jgi:uncharacterized glyoxalase superfamily protein PhnB
MSGIDRLAFVTVAVRDQAEALSWFTEKLDFEKRTDVEVPGMRFLAVSPRKQPEVQFILASWFPDQVGKNTTSVLHTEDCRATYDDLSARGVRFVRQPEVRPYGIEAVFEDLYGNKYALVEVTPNAAS